MKLAKPLLISFSLLAFASATAYANEDAKASSGGSSAASGSAAQTEDFSRLDKDGDGMVNRMEAAADADAKSRFETLDQNGDQKLSQQEYQDAGSASAGASGMQSSQTGQSQQSQDMQSQQGQDTQSQQSQDTQSQQSQGMQSEQSQGESASAGASSSGKSGQSQQQGQMKTSELIGKKVMDSQGKELGQINDVVLDLQGGKVHAAVLEFGGILGMGEKNYAFPISQLKQGKSKNQFTMDIDKQKLENAQGFAKGEWPEMDAEYWGRVGGQASAGQTGSQQQGQQQGSKQNMTLVRASELEGKSVQDKSGEDVGEIQDVVVDMKSGQLRNILVNVKDAGQAQVQAKALTKGTGDTLVLNMDAQQLKSQAKKSGKQAQSQGQSQGASSGSSGGSSGGSASGGSSSGGSSSGGASSGGASSDDATSKGISGGAAKPDKQ